MSQHTPLSIQKSFVAKNNHVFLFQQQIEQMQRIHCQKSMNAGVHRIKTNLANTHSMLMSANLFHSQNACGHCLVELIRFICSIRCSTLLPLNQWAAVSAFMFPPLSHSNCYDFWCENETLLSYCFTKKRSLKICKIENFNRQTTNKMMLIWTKKTSVRVGTLT